MKPAARLAVAAALVVLAGCASAGTGPEVTAPVPSVLPSSSSSGPHIVHDPGTVTGTLHGPCHATGTAPYQLPDPSCTPGAVDPLITAAILCAPGYTTRSYRPPAAVTTRFKYDVAYPAYGLPATAKTELDHLISLELGGANDASNLWPEPPPSPNLKDEEEGDLHNWVCSAKGAAAQDRLVRAQLAIAVNWVTAAKMLGVTSLATLSVTPAARQETS